jgi:hypothetical protein
MTSHFKSATCWSSFGIVLAVMLQLSMPAQANVDGTEKNQGAIVVELFTSEGCSSCPPADALLRQIDGKQTKDGRRIIGISEHVTYWNHLGWSDPFSDDVYTQRQDEYGRRFQLDSVYTPQIVIDGEVQLVGSDRDGLQRELDKSRKPQPITIQINAVIPRGDVVSVSYSLAGSLSSGGAELVAVIADDEARSNVARGENSGRVLTHVSVARTLKRIAAKSSPHEQTLDISVPRSSVTSPRQARRMILFLQEKGQGRVFCADEKSF